MANTYYQCYVHLIFAVKNPECLIHESNREKIQQYICGIVNQDKCKLIRIYCNPDHTHILAGWLWRVYLFTFANHFGFQ